MRKIATYLFVFCSIISGFICPAELIAAPYFEGKAIKIVVGFGPGGGYDRTARILAKYLPNYIPGRPTVLVENMAGASGIIAANHVYNLAKPDGLTLVALNQGLPIAQLTKVSGIRFDLLKYSWIGSAAIEGTVLIIRSDLPYKTVGDLQKAEKPIYISGMGPGAYDTQFPMLLKEFIGLNLKTVVYTSSADAMLAVERKEVDGRVGSYSSLKPLIDRGVAIPILRGRVSQPGIENLPVNENLTTHSMGRTIMGMHSSIGLIGRPYAAAPGTPKTIMDVLRDGFAKAIKDPELQKDAKRWWTLLLHWPARTGQQLL